MLSITDSILARAESIGPHLKTLDAIHLGTLLTIDPGMTLASHDDQLAEVARQLGVATFDPLP
jgi:predicted nucleic acid-binding protein